MKAKAVRFTSEFVAGFVIPVILSMSNLQAADAVQWADLSRKIGRSRFSLSDRKDRRYRVVTKDGRVLAGGVLFFNSSSLMLDGLVVPRERVVEIRVRRHGSLTNAFLAPAEAVTPFRGGADGSDVMVLIFSPVLLPLWLTATAAAAPIVLPVEGVKRLLQDRVIQVAP